MSKFCHACEHEHEDDYPKCIATETSTPVSSSASPFLARTLDLLGVELQNDLCEQPTITSQFAKTDAMYSSPPQHSWEFNNNRWYLGDPSPPPVLGVLPFGPRGVGVQFVSVPALTPPVRSSVVFMDQDNSDPTIGLKYRSGF